MQLSLQLSKLQGTTSYFDENVGRVGVKSDTVFEVAFCSILFTTKSLLLVLKFKPKKICWLINISRPNMY